MQRVAVDICRALAERDDIEFGTWLLEASGAWTGVRTFPFLLDLAARLPGRIRRDRIDAVLFSSMVTASVTVARRRQLAAAGAITAAIPVGRDLTLPNPAYQRFVPGVLRGLDVLFPISRATADAALARGADPRRVHVIPCGVDLPNLRYDGSRAALRASLLMGLRSSGHAVSEDALLLLSVGRHQRRKGFQWFVEEVMPRLGERCAYLLAGDGPMTDRIRQIVDSLGLGDRVFLLGRVSEERLEELYRGSDLFVMPNIPVEGDMEGFGVVMIEAGAAGLPVVASDLEGIRDVVTNGRNGRLVPTMSSQAFVEEINRYMDPRVLANESAGAARYVREHFAWPSIVDRYVAILRESRDRVNGRRGESDA